MDLSTSPSRNDHSRLRRFMDVPKRESHQAGARRLRGEACPSAVRGVFTAIRGSKSRGVRCSRQTTTKAIFCERRAAGFVFKQQPWVGAVGEIRNKLQAVGRTACLPQDLSSNCFSTWLESATASGLADRQLWMFSVQRRPATVYRDVCSVPTTDLLPQLDRKSDPPPETWEKGTEPFLTFESRVHH